MSLSGFIAGAPWGPNEEPQEVEVTSLVTEWSHAGHEQCPPTPTVRGLKQQVTVR
jgi:hypothetical protein